MKPVRKRRATEVVWQWMPDGQWSKNVVKLEIEGQRYLIVIAEVKDAQAAIKEIQSFTPNGST